MHPYIQHKLTDARVAGLHSHAERRRVVQAARRATRRPAAQSVAGPGLRHVLPALLTASGQRRHHGALAAQAPQGQRA